MKESELYINFLKRNSGYLIIPIILLLLISIYFYAKVPSQTKISQTFKMQYSLEDINIIITLTDQAVAQLREQRFAALFSGSKVSVYKSGPFNISIDSMSDNQNNAYALLLKETVYLKQNFSVSQLNAPEITQIQPNLLKYLISGLITGGLIGLLISLVREYLRNY